MYVHKINMYVYWCAASVYFVIRTPYLRTYECARTSVQAEMLFRRLAKVRDSFREWVVLGTIDIDALVEQHCVKLEDWEANFRALKTRGREVEKLPK